MCRLSIVLLLFTASLNVFAQQKELKALSPDEFKAKLEANKDGVLLDLRTDDEVKAGVIPGARQLDYFKLDYEDQVKKLDRNKTYFIYCAVGGRSGETFDMMKSLGFQRVYDLKGGFSAWKKKHLPISTDRPKGLQ